MQRDVFLVEDVRSAALRALNYSPRVELIRATPRKSWVPLRSLLSAMGPAYGTVFTRIDCDSNQGVELVSQSDMFAAEPQGRVIRRDSMARPERHEIHRFQVLVAGAGTLGSNELYGRSLIADGRLIGKYVGPDSMTLVFDDPQADRSLFAYAFLASPTGISAIRSTSYGTKILRFRDDLFGSLPIPIASDAVMARVSGLVRSSIAGRETYLTELNSARHAIEELPEMREAHGACAERKARAVLWGDRLPTLCAWTYASTGGVLGMLQKKWTGRLSDVLTTGGIFNGPRFARIPCEPPHGVEFMSQRDAFLIRPAPRQISRPEFDDRLLFAPNGTIMVGGHGTLGEGEIFGRAMLVYGRLSRSAFTQDLLRIIPRPEQTNVVYAFLTTLVGMRLLRSTAVGTKILSMRLDLLRDLPIPDLDDARRHRIETHVQASLRARESAELAEAEAIRIVEEEVLPTWLA